MQFIRKLITFDHLFFLFAFYLITNGLLKKEDSYLTAETGLGYTLGIVGGSMMLLLLLYPIRKHSKLMRNFGKIKYWFRMHMMLGVAGPVLVLYHANFGLGSTNSNVALFCMIIVASSGLFGRLFYSKIHDGLYGRKIELAELQKKVNDLKTEMDSSEQLEKLLTEFESSILKPRALLISIVLMPFMFLRSVFVKRKVVRQLTSQTAISEYLNTLVRVAHYSIYERLFSLWHVFHIPLFVMMIISGIVHVIAVHIY